MAKHTKRAVKRRNQRLISDINAVKHHLELARKQSMNVGLDLIVMRHEEEGFVFTNLAADIWDLSKRLPNVPKWWVENLVEPS